MEKDNTIPTVGGGDDAAAPEGSRKGTPQCVA